LEETALNEIDQLIESLDEPINNLIPIVEEELNEPNSLKASQISPFKGTTWKEKLNDILEKLPTHAKSRENQIKNFEAYYYLGTLIQENEAN
ncbi:14735_t:CDS:2, partial [Cetraspora pellucida]